MWSRIGGYLGGMVGLLGWLIGWTAVCLTSGNGDVLRQFFVGGLAVSLAMGFTLVIATEAVLRLYGRGHYMFSTALWGLLLSDAGVLLLLHEHWITPIVERSPRMQETLQHLGGWHRTGDTLPLVSLCAGAALLAAVALRVLGDTLRREP